MKNTRVEIYYYSYVTKSFIFDGNLQIEQDEIKSVAYSKESVKIKPEEEFGVGHPGGRS